MACMMCDSLEDIGDVSQPHVIRTCEECGRQIRLLSPSAHGIGIKVQKGDQVVFPVGSISISANPLKGTGQFTSVGLSWFAESVFGIDITHQSAIKTTFLLYSAGSSARTAA